jgi:hypothetical protein
MPAPELMLVWAGIWIGPNAAFALVSYRFFKTLTSEHARGFDVAPSMRVEPISPIEQHSESGHQ